MNPLTIDFAFEGFKTIQKARFNILAWGGVMVLAMAIGLGSFLPLALPAIMKLSSGAGVADPMAMMALMGSLVLPYFILLIVLVIAYSVVACAVWRVVLEDRRTTFAYLKLGADEGRNILVNILFGFVFMGIYLGVLLAGGLVGGLLGGVLSLINKNLMGLGLFVGFAAAFVALFWILIRLSLFSVLSFAGKKIDLFGSWKLTKGYAWTLLGGYIVAWIVTMLVQTLCMFFVWIVVAVMAVANIQSLQALGTMTTPDIGRILTAVAPMVIAYLLMSAFVMFPLTLSIMFSAPAAALRTLTGAGTAKVENLF